MRRMVRQTSQEFDRGLLAFNPDYFARRLGARHERNWHQRLERLANRDWLEKWTTGIMILRRAIGSVRRCLFGTGFFLRNDWLTLSSVPVSLAVVRFDWDRRSGRN
jgi:hypothetical protein